MSTGARAAGPENRSCIAAAEQGQLARYHGKLSGAREELVRCARPECPDPIHADCIRWLAEVETSLPSVVLGASWDGGGDVLDVQVTIDGEPVAHAAEGRAVPIDPGAHVVAFSAAGAIPQSSRVVIREGEKNRAVRVSLAHVGGSPAGASAALSRSTPARRPVPLASIVLGAVGAAAIADGVVWYVVGRSSLADMRSSCVDRCNSSVVDDERRKLVVGDISMAAGIVALGAATYLFLRRPSVDSTSAAGASSQLPHLDLTASPRGGSVGMSVTF